MFIYILHGTVRGNLGQILGSKYYLYFSAGSWVLDLIHVDHTKLRSQPNIPTFIWEIPFEWKVLSAQYSPNECKLSILILLLDESIQVITTPVYSHPEDHLVCHLLSLKLNLLWGVTAASSHRIDPGKELNVLELLGLSMTPISTYE